MGTVDQLDLTIKKKRKIKRKERGEYDTKIWVTEWVDTVRSGEWGG